MKWKTLSSEYLFNDLWFKVRRDRCESPAGKIIYPYYVYEFTDWVTAVALTEDEKVVMVRQYRHGNGEISLELPGGCVDAEDKNTEESVLRELKEETGYTFGSVEYLGKTSANPSTNNNWMHMFLARGGVKTGEQQLDHNEEIKVELYTLDELMKLLDEQKIIQAMHVTCIYYALRKIEKEDNR